MKEFVTERGHVVTFSLKAKDTPVVLNRLHREKVRLLGVKKRGEGTEITLPFSDCKKLFAICENMCYNIIWKRYKPQAEYRKSRATFTFKREGGFAYPFFWALKNFGVILGLVAFIAILLAFDGRIAGYTLNVPAECKSGVVSTLEGCGAVKGVAFKSLNLTEISQKIVEENSAVAFATAYKKGSFLVVDTVLAENSTQKTVKEDFLSPTDGKITKISVLRGTPLVTAGQTVKKGQPLVGAYFTAGEQIIQTSPVYTVEMEGVYKTSFVLAEGGEYYVSAAVAIAKEKCPFSHVIAHKTATKEVAEGVEITVELTYLLVLGG